MKYEYHTSVRSYPENHRYDPNVTFIPHIEGGGCGGLDCDYCVYGHRHFGWNCGKSIKSYPQKKAQPIPCRIGVTVPTISRGISAQDLVEELLTKQLLE